jgi:hypothetical protein
MVSTIRTFGPNAAESTTCRINITAFIGTHTPSGFGAAAWKIVGDTERQVLGAAGTALEITAEDAADTEELMISALERRYGRRRPVS